MSFVQTVKHLDPKTKQMLLEMVQHDKKNGVEDKKIQAKQLPTGIMKTVRAADELFKYIGESEMIYGDDAFNSNNPVKVDGSFGASISLRAQGQTCLDMMQVMKSAFLPGGGKSAHSGPSFRDDVLITIGLVAKEIPIIQVLLPGILSDLERKCSLLLNLVQFEG